MPKFNYIKKVLHYIAPFVIPLLVFSGTYLVYKNIYLQPRNWYDHYLHLATSFMEGRVDVPTLPSFYHDKIEFEGKNYLPFPPTPALLAIPFIITYPDIQQQQISIFIGALNAVLVYLILKKITHKLSALLLTIFYAFGTVAFWVSVVGTTWNYAHTVAIFFLALSILTAVYSQKHYWLYFLSGLFFTLAALSRLPVTVSGLFFVGLFWKDKKALLLFLLGAFVFIPATLYYNHLRFGDLMETGYSKVYKSYVDGGIGYSIQRVWSPEGHQFNYFDIRSIPYHLYTMFLMPPEIENLNIFKSKPSPFGMGILFTSPLLLAAFIPPFKYKLEKFAVLGATPVALLVFTHYAQGWVQFGYRFIMDFILFLMIILGLRFRQNKQHLFLLLMSVFVCTWGVLWGIQLGW